MSDTIPIRRPVVNVPEVVLKAASDRLQPKEEVKYPSEVIPLPTRGWFYPEGHVLSSGEVEIKQMSAREEDILANQELIRKGKAIDKLLEALLVDKRINIDEIYVPDQNAILIAVRRLAYGDEYPVSLKCPSCGSVNKVNINLGELKNKEYDFESHKKGENSFELTLPSGKTISYKLLNRIDERSIEAELTNLKKTSKEDIGREVTTRLKYLIVSVDGKSDKGYIRKFVDEQLSAKDSLALRRYMRDHNTDVDTTFDFNCNNCSFERRLDIPLGASFLWPDTQS